jgi:hypothetical protein
MTAPFGRGRGPTRRWARFAVAVAVTLMHVWLGGWALDAVFDAAQTEASTPQRLQVLFVKLMQPQAPPTTPPVVLASPPSSIDAPLSAIVRAAPPLPQPAASAPDAEAPGVESATEPAPPARAASVALADIEWPVDGVAPDPIEPPAPAVAAASPPDTMLPGDLASAPTTEPADIRADVPADLRADVRTDGGSDVHGTADDPAPAQMAAAGDHAPTEPVQTAAQTLSSAPAPSASSPAATFEWPLSTRLTYRLTGNFRGPVDGQAHVEWLRQGQRYQVHVDVSVGPGFAPLVSRRMSSDGEVGPAGLRPQRYDEVTRVALHDPRRQTVMLGGTRIRLAHGGEQPRPEGVQDSASQFVQMIWLFTTQPQRLRRGEQISMMLALPRRLDRWTYDVLDAEDLHTPVGVFEAVHVRPRPLEQPRGELSAEVWIAPTLQYMPARIVIRQDAETYVDLLLDRLPEQAAATPTR